MEGLCLMSSCLPSRSTPMADFPSWSDSLLTPSAFGLRPIESVNNSRVEEIARQLIEENIRIATSGASTNGSLQGASAPRSSLLRQDDVTDFLLPSTSDASRSLWDPSFPQGSALFEDALKNLQSRRLGTPATTTNTATMITGSSVFSSESNS